MTTEIKLAKALLQQKDQRYRRRQVIAYIVGLVLLFVAHVLFARMDTPLKLIPMTFFGISMGIILIYILSLRQFKYMLAFIDWEKVTQAAASGAEDSSNAMDDHGC